MYVLPLNPPIGTIDLKDPLIFVIGVGQKITKDLFFSGHTSTVFLIFLSVKNKKMKIIFLIAAILVGLFMMIQKAHYSVDVFVAPFVAFGVYKISEKIFSKSFQI
jgi:membrane-associated phospholipid phosphatase